MKRLKIALICILTYGGVGVSRSNPSLNQFGLSSSSKIKIYFNNPIDTTVSTSEHAIYLHNAIDDSLIAYINRAKYSIDVAVYNYIQSSSQIASISTAINNAYASGIKIRWIYDGSSSNSGLSQLNSAIPTLSSPITVDYGIMHNKFMIIDANSTNDSDAIVWTGSTNWNAGQMNNDVNNVIIIQDKNLALAYTSEFNEMWGDTGVTPDLVNSKFGPYKSDSSQHIFNIDGKSVECYFSPSDNTNDQIKRILNSANSDIYFGVYTFTMYEDANSIKDKILNQGVHAAGIIDQYSQGFTPYSILQPVMGSSLKVFSNSSTIYHNKLVIVDACDFSSDPVVLTGSHNWTISANTINDENTLIIHDSTIANIYYQSFVSDFANLGGTIGSCTTIGIDDFDGVGSVSVYPNPSENFIILDGLNGNFNSLTISDMTGKNLLCKEFEFNDKISLNSTGWQSGVYILLLKGKNSSIRKKIVVNHN